MYKNESTFVRHFVRRLSLPNSPWGRLAVSREFGFNRGRADIVALSGNGKCLIAFEAKLEKWRDALQQAYRNTCFAHSSYVALPRHVAMRATKHSQDFIFRNVGLCYIEGDRIAILLRARAKQPLQPWLLDAAVACVRTESKRNGRTRTNRPPDLHKAPHGIRWKSRRGHVQANLQDCKRHR